MPARLLVVEDDPQLNQMLIYHFEDVGYLAEGVLTCADALSRLKDGAFDLILLDQQLPDGTGLDLLTRIKQQDPEQAVIIITGQHDLELAIEAIKKGAAEYIHKPLKITALEQVVARVLAARNLAQEAAANGTPRTEPLLKRELIGRSEAMLAVSKEIALSAESAASVLISGESGTGKEVVARLIHQHSRRPGPFVAINCAALVDTLLESELFGHEKGAFTGALNRKPGKFELASEGTLFLDEIGELAPPLQAKLLRALQERQFERVGGTQPIRTNTRIIAATNRDLFAEMRAGRFREDLLYRLNVIAITLPPLRERKDDIELLAEALLQKIARSLNRPAPSLAATTLARMQTYDWPGNVRELENTLTQATVHTRGQVLTPDLLPFSNTETDPAPASVPGDDTRILRTLEEVEAEHIQAVLDHTGGHKSRSCEILNISRPALDRKIVKYQLRLDK